MEVVNSFKVLPTFFASLLNYLQYVFSKGLKTLLLVRFIRTLKIFFQKRKKKNSLQQVASLELALFQNCDIIDVEICEKFKKHTQVFCKS